MSQNEWESSDGGNASEEVRLFGDGFGAYREGIEKVKTKGKFEGFVLAVAKCTLAEDFHADDSLPCGFHFAQNADHDVGVSIHVRTDRIDADEVEVDPRRFCSSAKRFDRMA